MKNKFSTALKGAAMGVAEVIPGVSGGTIAFITGIYERLLNAIKAFGPSLFKTYKSDGFGGLWKAIDGTFLLSLFVGMVGGIVIGVFGVSHLLDNYPPVVWSFFFGLIIASAIYIGKQVERWDFKTISFLLIGAAIAYSITVLTPASGSTNLLFVFICGVVAISALILPGISGSFILLMLGMYTYIVTDTLKGALETFATDKLLTLTVFALGCLTGLMTVSRVLSWTFKNYRASTLAVLTGFMIGSLNKIWPWRNITGLLNKENGKLVSDPEQIANLLNNDTYKIVEEANVMPSAYFSEPYILWVVVFAVIGFAAVFLLEKAGKQE